MAFRISRIINGPGDPEELLRTLTVHELSSFIDARYRNLDTPSPEPGAETWYELAIEEELRRSASNLKDSAGVAGENAAIHTERNQRLPSTRRTETQDASGYIF